VLLPPCQVHCQQLQASQLRPGILTIFAIKKEEEEEKKRGYVYVIRYLKK
jgi:hypothetical protein